MIIASHPAWVCGLKLATRVVKWFIIVTPCVGVWIETPQPGRQVLTVRSHPAWVCGLKPPVPANKKTMNSHTLRGCVD